MTKERVDAMLKAYRFEVGRCGHLQAEINTIQRDIEHELNSMVETLASPKPQQLTDMPHGTEIGNPTERFGIMLASGYESAEIKELRVRLAELQNEYDERNKTVQHVSSWLSGLPERERWVVQMQVIDGVFWRDVSSRYRQTFQEDVSVDTLKRVRDRALGMIYRIAE